MSSGGSVGTGGTAGTNATGAVPGGAGSGATTGSVSGQAPTTTGREGGDAGIGGPRGTGSAQGGDACNDVLAKPGNFTKQVIEACRKRTGREPAPRTAGQDTGVNPVDAPSQVQKAREPQDKGAMRSICTNAEVRHSFLPPILLMLFTDHLSHKFSIKCLPPHFPNIFISVSRLKMNLHTITS